jgi:aryl-alcohol dehydrogenase-like predicted oxidoreductase
MGTVNLTPLDFMEVEPVRVVSVFQSCLISYAAEEMLGSLKLDGTTIDSKCYPVSAGDHSPEKVRGTLQTILEKLKTDRIRIFYLHAPDRSTPFEETCREINALHKEGLFEEFGLCRSPSRVQRSLNGWQPTTCLG